MQLEDIIKNVPIKPYYQDESTVIYNCDNRLVLPLFPDKAFDLVLFSPPYNLGNAKKGSFYGGKGKGLKIEYIEYNDDIPTKEYQDWQHEIINSCYAVLSDRGAIFYNHKPHVVKGIFDDRKNLIPLPIRQEIIWDRGGMVNFSGSFYAPNTERIFIIAKEEWTPRKECLGWGEIWRVAPETNNEHPAPYPLKLAERVISSATFETDLILDPFLGSGTTLVAAKILGRKAIGIEISEKYCDIAAKRLSQSVMQLEIPKEDVKTETML